MRINTYLNANIYFTIDRWMSEYIEMIGDLIGMLVLPLEIQKPV